MLAIWIIIFIASLIVLVRGSDTLIAAAESVGVHFGLPSFVIGVLIVGIGTSLPELVSGITAAVVGATDIVAANAVGSNIANILLIGGIAAVVGRVLTVTRDLIDAELPLFVISTLLFLGVAYDGTITFIESLFLFAGYVVYILYALSGGGEENPVITEAEEEARETKKEAKKRGISWREWTLLIGGAAAVVISARFLIESILAISDILSIVPGVIAISAVALGTSLPELFVSLRAIQKNKSDIAIGNIFGSNAFNVSMAVGIPGLIAPIELSETTLTLGLAGLAGASFIFLISGISKNIYRWEGLLFLIFYVLFTLKLLGVA